MPLKPTIKWDYAGFTESYKTVEDHAIMRPHEHMELPLKHSHTRGGQFIETCKGMAADKATRPGDCPHELS